MFGLHPFDAEANGEGLLIADLAQLHRKSSFQRYRVDLIGAAAAAVVVGLLIGLAHLIPAA